MAPRVIGEDQTVAKRITHRSCGRVIEYFEGDVRTLREGRDYSGGSDGAEGFTCPHCGRDVVTRAW